MLKYQIACKRSTVDTLQITKNIYEHHYNLLMVMSSLPIGTNYVKFNYVLVKLKYLPKKHPSTY